MVFKAVLFDCFGVLTTDISTVFLDDIHDDMKKIEFLDLRTQLDARLIGFDDFSNKTYEILGKYPPDIRQVHKPIKNITIFKEISRLKAKNFKVGMISNISNDWITSIFLDNLEQDLFDEMVLSYEVGLAKPDKRIYELALQRLGASASQTIFVDDNKDFCDSAEKVGITTIHFVDNNSLLEKLNTLIK